MRSHLIVLHESELFHDQLEVLVLHLMLKQVRVASDLVVDRLEAQLVWREEDTLTSFEECLSIRLEELFILKPIFLIGLVR